MGEGGRDDVRGRERKREVGGGEGGGSSEHGWAWPRKPEGGMEESSSGR